MNAIDLRLRAAEIVVTGEGARAAGKFYPALLDLRDSTADLSLSFVGSPGGRA